MVCIIRKIVEALFYVRDIADCNDGVGKIAHAVEEIANVIVYDVLSVIGEID